MRVSLCIPNYNYARYIGQTIESALAQTAGDIEVLVSDNASTDKSLEVIQAYAAKDARIKVRVNSCNVGFAGNLDRVCRMGNHDWMILLSSDDLMTPDAIYWYERLLGAIGDDAKRAIITSSNRKIDGEGNPIGWHGPDRELFFESDRVEGLPAPEGAKVYRVEAREMLRRSLQTMRNPFPCVSTCYPRWAYEKIEGYGGGRLYGPDKWLHWRLLGLDTVAYFIDYPLFLYRWHDANQAAIQSRTGTLKYIVDDYLNTVEFEKEFLESAGMTRTDLEKAFIQRDIVRHGLKTLAQGNYERAQRIYDFGRSAYPAHMKSNKSAHVFGALLQLGPLGTKVVQHAYDAVQTDRPSAVKTAAREVMGRLSLGHIG